MRLLSLALVSAFALTGACPTIASSDAETSALPQIVVPDLSEQTMKDVTRELSLDTYEGRAPGANQSGQGIALPSARSGCLRPIKGCGFAPSCSSRNLSLR